MNIGLTGGIGCGKSTALAYFQEKGAHVVDTDAVGRELLEKDPVVKEEILNAFGGSVFNQEGMIDRGLIASRVFSNSEELALLESIVHPRIRQNWMHELRKNYPILIVEIPLLFEKDLQEHFSKTICLSSAPEVQEARLLTRGMNQSQINYRKKQQLGIEEKMRRADIVIHNNGSLDHLKEQVDWVMKQIADCSNQ